MTLNVNFKIMSLGLSATAELIVFHFMNLSLATPYVIVRSASKGLPRVCISR